MEADGKQTRTERCVESKDIPRAAMSTRKRNRTSVKLSNNQPPNQRVPSWYVRMPS